VASIRHRRRSSRGEALEQALARGRGDRMTARRSTSLAAFGGSALRTLILRPARPPPLLWSRPGTRPPPRSGGHRGCPSRGSPRLAGPSPWRTTRTAIPPRTAARGRSGSRPCSPGATAEELVDLSAFKLKGGARPALSAAYNVQAHAHGGSRAAAARVATHAAPPGHRSRPALRTACTRRASLAARRARLRRPRAARAPRFCSSATPMPVPAVQAPRPASAGGDEFPGHETAVAGFDPGAGSPGGRAERACTYGGRAARASTASPRPPTSRSSAAVAKGRRPWCASTTASVRPTAPSSGVAQRGLRERPSATTTSGSCRVGSAVLARGMASAPRASWSSRRPVPIDVATRSARPACSPRDSPSWREQGYAAVARWSSCCVRATARRPVRGGAAAGGVRHAPDESGAATTDGQQVSDLCAYLRLIRKPLRRSCAPDGACLAAHRRLQPRPLRACAARPQTALFRGLEYGPPRRTVRR